MLNLNNPYYLSVIKPAKLLGQAILGIQQAAWEELMTRDELNEVISLAEHTLLVYDTAGYTDADIEEINRYNFENYDKEERVYNRELAPKKQPKKDHLYIIRDLDFAALKIGRSINPESRLKSLSTSSANRMEIVKVYPEMGCWEEEVHNALKAAGLHIRSEWFTDDPKVIELVENFLEA